MTRPADSASRLMLALGTVGLAALLVITLASPGATRMYAWPWSLAYDVALVVPALLLVRRAFDSRHPLILPARSWTGVALAVAAVVLASALQSPWRGPALQWSAPLLAAVTGFFLAFDWLQSVPARRASLLTGAGIFFAVVALAGTGLWLAGLPGRTAGEVWTGRNPYPLGHSNYTAGLALLMLPLFPALALRDRGARRAGWLAATGLAAVMLLTSGSRGGLIGLAVLVAVHLPAVARALRLKLWLVFAVSIVVLAAVLAANPRTRTMLAGATARATLQASDVQRSAMAKAGLLMGLDRPLLGWGPGTTPLAYPYYRRFLDGGVENVLQLHSTPVQVWAELGAAGLITALAFIGLALLASRSSLDSRRVLLALSGYVVFCLTDWQLDVPVFSFALAIAAALLVPSAARVFAAGRIAVGAGTLAALALIGLFGRRDPTPELNVRALALARDPAQAAAAIALLNESLALNPAQEIAHFNLGWLLVVRDPAAAEQHFLAAAQLVPDKGGVYFGLGLARLNQGHRDPAVRAFALECLNDPIFLTSPWWRDPAVGQTRIAVNTLVLHLLGDFPRVLENSPADREAIYLAALIDWLDGHASPGQILAAADTPERVAYFARQPAPPDFDAAPGRLYRRERTGYPVLMRNLDLATPVDLFDVQENALAVELRPLFPTKGWLPSPVLLTLLDAPVSPKK
jgi:O-antigen ligase